MQPRFNDYACVASVLLGIFKTDRKLIATGGYLCDLTLPASLVCVFRNGTQRVAPLPQPKVSYKPAGLPPVLTVRLHFSHQVFVLLVLYATYLRLVDMSIFYLAFVTKLTYLLLLHREKTPAPSIGAKRIDNQTADDEQPGPAETPDPSAWRVTTHDTLTFSALNVGGVEIAPKRLCYLLAGFVKMSHPILLSEFRPSSGSHLQDHARVA